MNLKPRWYFPFSEYRQIHTNDVAFKSYGLPVYNWWKMLLLYDWPSSTLHLFWKKIFEGYYVPAPRQVGSFIHKYININRWILYLLILRLLLGINKKNYFNPSNSWEDSLNVASRPLFWHFMFWGRFGVCQKGLRRRLAHKIGGFFPKRKWSRC